MTQENTLAMQGFAIGTYFSTTYMLKITKYKGINIRVLEIRKNMLTIVEYINGGLILNSFVRFIAKLKEYFYQHHVSM